MGICSWPIGPKVFVAETAGGAALETPNGIVGAQSEVQLVPGSRVLIPAEPESFFMRELSGAPEWRIQFSGVAFWEI